jgi:hypothetical protein
VGYLVKYMHRRVYAGGYTVYPSKNHVFPFLPREVFLLSCNTPKSVLHSYQRFLSLFCPFKFIFNSSLQFSLYLSSFFSFLSHFPFFLSSLFSYSPPKNRAFISRGQEGYFSRHAPLILYRLAATISQDLREIQCHVLNTVSYMCNSTMCQAGLLQHL